MTEVGCYERLLDGCVPVPEAGCWLWARSVSAQTGYGSFWMRGKNVGAHRASWELHKGPVASNEIVCHKCDTPSCVNPDHLFLGSQADNIADMFAKGRQHSNAGTKHGQHKLTEAHVREIRRRAAVGESSVEIAGDYPVTARTVRAIVSGKGWKHVR